MELRDVPPSRIFSCHIHGHGEDTSTAHFWRSFSICKPPTFLAVSCWNRLADLHSLRTGAKDSHSRPGETHQEFVARSRGWARIQRLLADPDYRRLRFAGGRVRPLAPCEFWNGEPRGTLRFSTL